MGAMLMTDVGLPDWLRHVFHTCVIMQQAHSQGRYHAQAGMGVGPGLPFCACAT